MPSSPSPELRPLLIDRATRWVPVRGDAAALSAAPGTIVAVEALVVHREVLREVELHLRGARARALGVLRGAIYRCPRMRLDYLLVEGVLRAEPLVDTEDVAARRSALAALIARIEHDIGEERENGRAVGWYRGGGGASVLQRIEPGDVVTHATLFTQPWAVTLLRDGAGARGEGGGAFVRLSHETRRPYMTPFYELLPAEPRQAGEPLGTAVLWTNYQSDTPVEPLPDLVRSSQAAVPFSGPTASDDQRSVNKNARTWRTSSRVGPFVPGSATPVGSPTVVAPAHTHAGPPTDRPPPLPPDTEASSFSSPPVSEAPLRTHEPSAVDRIFDDPPPPYLAADTGRTRRPTRRWRDGVSPTNWRTRRSAVVVGLIVVALAGTWFAARVIGGASGLGRDAALGDARTGSVGPTPSDSAPASANDSTAIMATFATQRLRESMTNMDHELRLIASALDTTGYGSIAPGACALADSAHIRSLLDLDAITLAEHYLKAPLGDTSKQRVATLTRRADAAGVKIKRACP